MAVNACDRGSDPTLPATWRLIAGHLFAAAQLPDDRGFGSSWSGQHWRLAGWPSSLLAPLSCEAL